MRTGIFDRAAVSRIKLLHKRALLALGLALLLWALVIGGGHHHQDVDAHFDCSLCALTLCPGLLPDLPPLSLIVLISLTLQFYLPLLDLPNACVSKLPDSRAPPR